MLCLYPCAPNEQNTNKSVNYTDMIDNCVWICRKMMSRNVYTKAVSTLKYRGLHFPGSGHRGVMKQTLVYWTLYVCVQMCACVSIWVIEWQKLIKVCSTSSILVICAATPQGTNRMRLDLAVNAAGPIMHYEEKFISLFLLPFTSLNGTFAHC